MTARVAEYQRLGNSVLYRVTGLPDWPAPQGIIYVTDRDGTLTAETFGGRPLPEVPPAARAAVIAYIHDHPELRLRPGSTG